MQIGYGHLIPLVVIIVIALHVVVVLLLVLKAARSSATLSTLIGQRCSATAPYVRRRAAENGKGGL